MTDNDRYWETEGPTDRSEPFRDSAVEYGRHPVTVPVANCSGWQATWVFEVLTRPPRPVSVRIHPTKPDQPPGPLDVRVLRNVKVTDAKEQLRRDLRLPEAEELFGVSFDVDDLARRPGSAGRDDYQYAALAADYVSRLGRVSAPVQAVADARNMSRSRVQNVLNEARNRGLLTRPGGRRAGGDLTAKARKVLDRGPR